MVADLAPVVTVQGGGTGHHTSRGGARVIHFFAFENR
jgi:hypothetical protein